MVLVVIVVIFYLVIRVFIIPLLVWQLYYSTMQTPLTSLVSGFL